MALLAAASTIVVVAGTVVLTWSGLEKIRDRSPMVSTATGLGMPSRLANLAAVIVPCLELATVMVIVAGAPRYVGAVFFVALGLMFALSAVWSMATGRVVACACFGASTRKLGWRQIGALPLWLLAGWSMTRLPDSSLAARIAILAGGTIFLVAVRAILVIRRWIESREDRWAAEGN